MIRDKLVAGCALLLASLGVTAAYADRNTWGYTGATGPDHWSMLNLGGQNQCGNKAQSPINLDPSTSKTSALPRPVFNSEASPMTPTNNGHTVQLSSPGLTSTATFNGAAYKLLQIHFHWPSEHAINGKGFPLEMRFVYANTPTANTPSGSSMLNVSVLFQDGSENALLKDLVALLPSVQEVNTQGTSAVTINPAKFFSATGGFYSYKGSLTTPPCSEIVTWIVMDKALKVSEAQVKAFKGLMTEDGQRMTFNARPLQDLNYRAVSHTAAAAK